ncbi:SusC/RagA family TonB-linked outer membrane protein [Neptunitalea lumnitzerae]|uniref:SusC/RagA family TonB-linked outer membrane protein n=1 Tax=Neptunitalea lumnitzerae TaxID=2965509 RepID=A0ABQ5MLQ2_9FLAO|nr:SusC/RagA family TonB-linked outer membrane protein [Neptunitalea sp. Y10]GLB50298.1 SusC/RagA family TonB-linked outer membrane protein [Neptunitalea sp. Y10]
MKKPLNTKRRSTLLLPNFDLKMKLSIFFVFLTLFSLQAKEVYGQRTKVSVNLEKVKVSRFLDEIENSTDFRFIYKVTDVDLNRVISVNANEETISSVLADIFKYTNTEFKILSNRIYLTKEVNNDEGANNTKVVPVQKQTVQGKVVDEIGMPLPGAYVLEQGTTNGTTTDFDGAFTLELIGENPVLEVSYLGFVKQEVAVTAGTEVAVIMKEEASSLDEVVVTALGIKREKKALGYASQELDADKLAASKEPNFVNSMAGKVAGVNITNSPSGIGGSSLITIRGVNSLDIGKNSPLFIIDGTPVGNNFYSPGGDSTRDVDYGNGAGEINPENIESVNILKGPAAAALYGSRAANGAIVITTKSGASSKGKVTVNLNTGITFQTLLTMPDWQNEYGQGNNLEFQFVDGAGSGINDGLDESWGPRLDNGLMIAQFDSPREDGTRGGDVDVSNSPIIPTAWASNPDNVNDFFDTGIVTNYSLSVAKSGDFGSYRIAYQNMNQEGVVPNTDLKRNNFNISSKLNLYDGLTLNAHVNYLKQDSDNRPSVSYGTENVMYLWVWYGRQVNTNSLRNYWQEGLDGVQQFNYNYNYHDNPFFNVYENTNSQDRDRIYGNVSLNYELGEHFNIMLRTGRDFYRDFRTKRRAFSTQRFPRGYYREDNIFAEEINSDLLVTYDNTFNDKWKVNISAGANRLDARRTYQRDMADELINPDVFSFSNARTNVRITESDYEKRVNSVYGFGRFSYDEKIFLEVSARNDWSSTLPENNNSYFYPSANLSVLVNEFVNLPKAFTFVKLRAAVAAVGNDTDPYNNGQASFSNGGTYDGSPILSESSTITNGNLKPENTTSYEFGADLRFFDNRLRLDATAYKSITTNQILSVPADIASGYSNRFINLGEVENRGVELMLGGTPVRNKNFNWNVTANFSTNESEVRDLDGIDFTIYENKAYIQAREGGSISAMYGRGFQRVEDENSPYYGQIIYDASGAPMRTDDIEYQGDYAPDFMLGLNNEFRFKNFDIGFLFDWRQGGTIVSRTKVVGSLAGQLQETLVGRETGIVGEGVVQVSEGVYEPNTTLVSARSYFHDYYKSDNVEASKYDATYLKLREVSVGYSLPAKICKSLYTESIRLSVTGRNLALWTENPHFDPETLTVDGGRLTPGYEYMSIPSTRSFTFNLDINF